MTEKAIHYAAALGHEDDVAYAVAAAHDAESAAAHAIIIACHDSGYGPRMRLEHLDGAPVAADMFRAVPISKNDYVNILTFGYEDGAVYQYMEKEA